MFDRNPNGEVESDRVVRVLLVDDSLLFIQAVEEYLRLVRNPSCEVVGRASCGQEALRLTAEVKPDLVLLDLVMPGMNGPETARQIKALPDPPRVIALTFYDLPAYHQAALNAQVDGFVGKADFAARLMPYIRKLFSVQVPLCNEKKIEP
ncbi:MAG: hypothetical protein Kow00106_09260 [Anaerolineae bacterium]